MEKIKLKELLSMFQGKYLEYPVYVECDNIKYYINAVGYNTLQGTYFECSYEETNITTLREILSLLHYHNLNNFVTIKIEDEHLDITELISNKNSLILKS